MELFKDTRFDFLGRKWWFILPSLILTFAGLVSLLIKGGPRYSIDFQGGALMEVRWEGRPPIERIRAVVSSRLSGVSVVAAHDLTGSNEVLVSAEHCKPPEGKDTCGALHPARHRSQASRIGLAMKIDEKVPTTIPITSASENPRNTGPPKRNSERAVSSVSPEVKTVRLSVWLMLRLIVSARGSRPYV